MRSTNGRIGRALRNSASMISGLVHLSGPQRVNRCSRTESSLVNLNTSLGDGPSMDGTTVSSRATSSATQRRPLGSVYLAVNARRLVSSMARGCERHSVEQGLVPFVSASKRDSESLPVSHVWTSRRVAEFG